MADAASRGADERFERIATRFISEPTVSRGTGFGASPGLRVRGKIFAMLAGDALVVKLPKDRVDRLAEAGVATRFDAGHGRVMKEWVTVPVDQADEWDQLAADAFAYVLGRSWHRPQPAAHRLDCICSPERR
jgi:hypothetical protein